jgi:hypothetical protein
MNNEGVKAIHAFIVNHTDVFNDQQAFVYWTRKCANHEQELKEKKEKLDNEKEEYIKYFLGTYLTSFTERVMNPAKDRLKYLTDKLKDDTTNDQLLELCKKYNIDRTEIDPVFNGNVQGVLNSLIVLINK